MGLNRQRGHRDDWLLGLNSRDFWRRVELRSQQLQQLPQANPVLWLAEPEPLDFLIGLFAAAQHPCTLVLCNPTWGQQEWQQLQAQIGGDLVWGHPPIQPIPSAQFLQDSAPNPCPISHPVLIPTGGSSGRVKLAVHTWDTLGAAVPGFCQHFQLATVTSYCLLPLYHVSGLMQVVRSHLTNGQLWLKCDRNPLNPSQIPAVPPNSVLSLVPTQLQRLLDQGQATWLRSFQAVLLGGAPPWASLLNQARNAEIPVALTYGMTETAAMVTAQHPSQFLQGDASSGTPFPQVRLSLDSASPDQITLTTPALAWGYWGDLQGFNGQFQPGDWGQLDAQGQLQLLGRQQNRIITGGEKVFPEEVEAALISTGLVQDIAVVGLPDQQWGEVVTAVYVPAHSTQPDSACPDSTRSEITPDQIQTALGTTLSTFKRPKQWWAVPRLTRTIQGKIQRDRIRDLAQQHFRQIMTQTNEQ
jgi:O-succinylbenzoic acid--CoA ligase